MQEILTLLIPAAAVFILMKIITAPMRLIFKLLLNTACGFLCLLLLNTISGFTGYVFALNFLTAAVVGVLGVPGIILLVLAGIFL